MPEVRTWIDLVQQACLCPVCERVMFKSEIESHLDQDHWNSIVAEQEITIDYDISLLDPLPKFIYVCSQCHTIPREIFEGIYPRTEIEKHVFNTCPAREDTPARTFKPVSNPEMVAALLEGRHGKLFFCTKDEEAFTSGQGVLKHFSKTHVDGISKNALMRKYDAGEVNESVRQSVEYLENRRRGSSPNIEHEPFIDETTPPDDEPKATSPPPKKPGGLVRDRLVPESGPFRTPIRTPVPHRRSLLKQLAGISDEEVPTAKVSEPGEPDTIEDEPGEKGDAGEQYQYAKKVLTHGNFLYGHIGLSKEIRGLIREEPDEIRFMIEGSKHIACRVNREDKILEGGKELATWFSKQGILPGCYVYVYPTKEDDCLELAYATIATTIKRCLIATWDSKAKRVVLKYEDIEVNVECSEHLFRSLVNVDDHRVLASMAKLYGSVFDVLYLGMRDLAASGFDTVHYHDLHNMVIDKRLHPQLGSVVNELRLNTSFKRLGGGYWQFVGDPRIEKVLPPLFETIAAEEDPVVSEPTAQEPVGPEPKDVEQPSVEGRPRVEVATPVIAAPASEGIKPRGIKAVMVFLKTLFRSIVAGIRSIFSSRPGK